MSTKTRFVSWILLLLTHVAFAQIAAQPASQLHPARRVIMTECEGVDNCTTWTFLSEKGYGKWRTGEEAVLEVKSAKLDNVVILRTDVTGSRSGLTATYTGHSAMASLAGSTTIPTTGKAVPVAGMRFSETPRQVFRP